MIVSAHNLRFRYPRSAGDVLHGLDFDIAEGEIFGFLGPNGSGKSTTQKVLTGILPAYRGAVQVFGVRGSEPHGGAAPAAMLDLLTPRRPHPRSA